MIRAATPAGLAGSLMQDHSCSALAKPHRRSESGDSGADDMNIAFHQTKAFLIMIQTSRARGRWMGRRGAIQPRSTNASRIAR